jgi:hypothetical protein
MPPTKKFRVIWVSPNHGNGESITAAADMDFTYDGSPVTFNKTNNTIGVLSRPNLPREVSLSTKLIGRAFIAKLTGKDAWSVRLVNSLGMVIASKKFSGNSTGVVAEKLPSGVYFAQFIYGKELVGKKTIVVP